MRAVMAMRSLALVLASSSAATVIPAATPASQGAPTSGVPGASAGAPPRAPRRAHVELGLEGLAPVPLVRGSLGGQPTWILLDTGASVHVVTGWAARRAHLPTQQGGGGVQDHAGVSLDGRKADLAAVHIDGWGQLPSAPMLVLEQDARGLGARAGIGVVLSPQLLAKENESVLLDLESRDLRIVSDDEATRVLGTRKAELVTAPVDACGGIYTVAAALDGQAASLVVDTGAASSDVSSSARAARALSKRSAPSARRHDAASGALSMRTVRGVKVTAGGHAALVDLGLFSSKGDAECPSDGDLGVDALRSCVLVFGGSPVKMRARCGR